MEAISPGTAVFATKLAEFSTVIAGKRLASKKIDPPASADVVTPDKSEEKLTPATTTEPSVCAEITFAESAPDPPKYVIPATCPSGVSFAISASLPPPPTADCNAPALVAT